MNERFCRSFTSLTDRGLFEELEIITNNADKLYENSNSIEILVSNKNCEVAADRVNAIVITLISESTTLYAYLPTCVHRHNCTILCWFSVK